MRDLLARWQGNGQALNKNLQLLITSILSLAVGVLGTLIFQSSQKSVELIRSVEIKREAPSDKSEERRPFFVKNETHPSEEKSEAGSPTSGPEEKTSEGKTDYFALSKSVEDFQGRVREEVDKKYKANVLGKASYRDHMEKVISKYNFLFEEKRLWFKATVEIPEASKARMHLFMNFYNCPANRPKKLTTENICFVAWVYVKYKEKWERYSISSNVDYYSWKDDVPYVSFNLENLGRFSRENRLLVALLPVPEIEEGFLQVLRYDNEKFQWIDAGRPNWQETNEKDAKAFERNVDQNL